MGSIVIGAQDVKIRIKLPDLPSILIESGQSLNTTISRTVQEVWGIGSEPPIDLVTQNAQYSASLTLQSGEYQLLLDAINNVLATPVAGLHQVPEFTLSKTYTFTSTDVPKTVTETLLRCKIESESADVSANDIQTTTTLQIRGIGKQRLVEPIA